MRQENSLAPVLPLDFFPPPTSRPDETSPNHTTSLPALPTFSHNNPVSSLLPSLTGLLYRTKSHPLLGDTNFGTSLSFLWEVFLVFPTFVAVLSPLRFTSYILFLATKNWFRPFFPSRKSLLSSGFCGRPLSLRPAFYICFLATQNLTTQALLPSLSSFFVTLLSPPRLAF